MIENNLCIDINKDCPINSIVLAQSAPDNSYDENIYIGNGSYLYISRNAKDKSYIS